MSSILMHRWNRDTAANMRDVADVQQLVDELVRGGGRKHLLWLLDTLIKL